MEEQHPIPQQISSYQFRLVGDMTLKQFFQVAAGALIALFLYASSLPNYLRWPGIIVSFLAGVAFAFFPIQDRPLSVWLRLFFMSIYSPTIYVWKKGVKGDYFQPETSAPPVIKEELVAQTITSAPLAAPEPVLPFIAPSEPTEVNTSQFDSLINGNGKSAPLKPTEFKPTDIAKDVKPEINVPEEKEIIVEKEAKDLYPTQDTVAQSSTSAFVNPSLGQKAEGAKEAVFSSEAAPPAPPTISNVVVGQVMDAKGNIVDNAILEIKDENGRSVRALRSNKLGHFMIVTPLTDGTYQLTTEKDGYNFEPLSFNLDGSVVEPIAVRASEPSQQELPKENTIYEKQ